MIDLWLITTKITGIIVGVGLVIVAYCVRKLVGSWFAPGSIFALLWAVFLILPTIMVPMVPLNVSCLIYIFLTCLVFACGVAPFQCKKNRTTKNANSCASEVFDTPIIWASFATLTVASIGFTTGTLLVQGFSWDDLLFNTLATSSKFAGMRYAEELTSTYFIQGSLLANYVGSALGGFLFAVEKKTSKRGFLAVCAFLPAVLIMITQSAKGGLFLSFAYFWGAMNVCSILNGNNSLVTKNGLKLLLKSAIVLLPLIGFSFFARGVSQNDSLEEIGATLNNYFSSYFFGHLYSFSDWYSGFLDGGSSIAYASNHMRFGLYTFNGLFNFFGNTEPLPQGVYDEYFSIENVITTNIYTWFRGLLMDFGLVGSFVFVLLMSFFAHWGFHKLINSRRTHAMYAAYVIMTGLFVHSFLASLFMYNSTYVTFIFLWLVLTINGAVSHKKTCVISSIQPLGN